MATVNYKCPNCGGPLTFNPDKQMFSCEYCLTDFSEKKIQELYAEKEAKKSQAETAEEKAQQQAKQNQNTNEDNQNNAEEEAVVYTCPSCGAEVVTTESTAATTCFYCQNPVVLGGRLSGDYRPDRIIPFALSKEKAIEKFLEMCSKKKFLPSDFSSKNQFDKFQGVYFPYWYVDAQKQATMTATGKKIKTWTSGRKTYTETSVYRVVRGGDLIINNVFERALKSQDRDMLQCVHPFDMTKSQKFSMSYLSGFQAEKRDIERDVIAPVMEERLRGYCKQILRDNMSDYVGVVPENYSEKTDLESWNYDLLPVWVTTYKYKDKIYPYAINGQTGKTYGQLPTSNGKLAILFAILTVALIALGFLGGLLFL